MSETEEAICDIVKQEDGWLREQADLLSLTLEQLAEQYEIEVTPREFEFTDATSVRFTETIRLVKRPVSPPQEGNNHATQP